MGADWVKIKTEYISGGISYRDIAKKYGVSFGAVRAHGEKEGWPAQRTAHMQKISTETAQMIVEKTSEALSDEAAAKVRIKASMLRLAEGWFDKQERFIAEDPERRVVNPGDFRKMVQSCVELGLLDVQNEEETSGDGLLEALSSNAGSLFADGDDSDMVAGG